MGDHGITWAKFGLRVVCVWCTGNVLNNLGTDLVDLAANLRSWLKLAG